MNQQQQYHHFDGDRIYTGSTPIDVDARDPDVIMPPPYGATLAALPALAVHETARLQADDTWAVLADWRGSVYWTVDGVEHSITEAGVVPPADALLAKPAASLANLKVDKLAELDGDTAQAIVSGFQSSALGTAHTYPSKLTDQANLNVSVTASLLKATVLDWATPFWCADQAGQWTWRQHTAAQIQQVGEDGMAAVLACQEKNVRLQAQVAAAETADQVAAIKFS